jgi:hypothetical protein
LKYFSLIAATVALGTEVLVFLLLMKMPPFGKGGSDVIWDLPLVGFVVFWTRDFWVDRRTPRQTKRNTR